MTAPEQMRAQWQPISTVDRVNGLRLILAWDDCPNLSYHWEVGRWSRDLGWVNTYGKPFGAGEPTHWMIPEAPSASTRPAPAELVEALEKCRDTFAEYAEMHRRKLTSTSDSCDLASIHAKIERNRDMCDLCIAALRNAGAAS